MEAEWNLDTHQSFLNINVIQLSMDARDEDEKHLATKFRMLILSNQIAMSGVPAAFAPSSPSYATRKSSSAVVLVFDCFENFDTSALPFWCVSSAFEWDATKLFTDEICEHFLRALTLCNYYRMIDMKPMYFTSFLLFPSSGNVLEPFLFQQVPVLKDGVLRLRTVVQDGLGCIVGSRKAPSKGDFLLVPPLNHPVLVHATDERTKQITVVTVDRVTLVLDAPVKFVKLTKPSLVLHKLFTSDAVVEVVRDGVRSSGKLCQFKDIDPFTFTAKDLEEYFNQRGAEDGTVTPETDVVVSVLEDPEPSTEQILSEEVSDPQARARILECIGRNAILPPQEPKLTCIVANFLSFFRFDFGFSTVGLPKYARRLADSRCSITSKVPYARLGIPRLIVNMDGKRSEIEANEIIQRWEDSKMMPISGEKNCHYVVFALQNIPRGGVEDFMRSLSHSYTQYGFGNMTRYPKDDYFHHVQPSTMKDDITRFFRTMQTVEFQTYPVITFIVSDPIYDPHFVPHSILTYIRPSSINYASDVEIRSLAFVVYSRMRAFNPEPYGMLNVVTDSPAAVAIFGHRYAPPFQLSRRGDTMQIHIAWDDQTGLCAIIDDVGSVLHHLQSVQLANIIEIMRSFKEMLDTKLSGMTLTVLGEGLTTDQYQTYSRALDQNGFDEVQIFTVSPAPGVEASFPEAFGDDAIIFDSPEQMYETPGPLARAQASCYVISQHNPPYKASIYKGEDPNKSLELYVTAMSHLTWCSVKPGIPNRTISYPPHVCALLRKNECRVQTLSRFEFLPSTEPI